MPALSLLKLTDKLACQGVQAVYGVLRPDELESASDILAVDDQESFTFQYSRLDQTGSVRPITAQMRAGRVIAPVWSDASFDEWRVATVEIGRGKKGLITVTCVPLWLDLVERSDSTGGKGWVSDLVAGTRNYDYEITQKTPTQIWSAYVIPNCPTWVGSGTIDPTFVIPTLTVTRLTPGALANAVCATLNAVDIPCEVRLRRNGTTDYKLDLVTQIGASANTPVFHPSVSLVTLLQKSDPTLQATRVLTTGGMAPDGLPGIWGNARWRSGAPSGNTFALTDPNGGASPIAFDNEFVGNYLLRVKTGRTFLITASSASGGTVTVSSISSIAAGEDFEFRLTEPLTNTRRVGSLDGATRPRVRPFVISVIAGSVFTLVDNFGTSKDPVSVNNENVDWYARRASFVMNSSFTTNFTTPGVIGGCASTAGIVAGDLLFITTSAAPSYGLTNTVAYIVDSTTVNSITVHQRDANATPFFFVGAGFFRVYRPVATLHRITASTAASDQITVDAVGTAATSDIVEFVQVDGAGETPCFVDHPVYAAADPVGYGIKVMELARQPIGVTQIGQNAWERTWSNPANPPDGWSFSGAGTPSRNSTAAFTRFGGFSYRLQGACAAQTPVVYPVWDAGHTFLSARALVYCTTFTGNTVITFIVYAATPSGAPGDVLGTATITPVGSVTAATNVNLGTWLELALVRISLADGTAPYGVVGVVSTPAGCDVYLDAVEWFAFETAPSANFEFGDATALLQAGNNKLREVASPPLFYTFGVLDLERAFPDEFARLKPTLGGNVRAADVEYGIDATVRLLKMSRNLLTDDTQFELANRPTLVANLLSTGAITQSRVIDAINDGTAGAQAAGAAFVALTAATTLTHDAEISTPAVGAPVVTLPSAPPPAAGETGTGSSVAYVPANPTTTPTVVITAGTPPSRRRPITPF